MIERQLAEQPHTDQPTTIPNDHRRYQEISHVFHCMQCDLQLQMDIAVLSQEASTEIDGGIVRVRLDPRIKLERA